MSRLFTFFEILSHNLAFDCAPTASTIHHRPYATLVLPTSARLSPRWGNTTLCAAIVCDNTPRSIARIAQTRYALHATAISLRSIRLRHALLPMRAIRAFVHGYFATLNTPCQLRYALNRLFALNPTPYEPYLPSHRPHIFPTYSVCAENLPAPRQILKIVEKKRLTYCFLS